MLERGDWVENQLIRFKGCRKDVINFIGDILFHSGSEESEVIRTLFHAGYCYYFAKILEDAFGGEVCWHKGFGHIVWKDADYCYDIEGVFDDYDDNEIVPVACLGTDLENFRHRGLFNLTSSDVKDAIYFNTILLDPLWEKTDYSVKEIKQAFSCVPLSTKGFLSAEKLLELLKN